MTEVTTDQSPSQPGGHFFGGLPWKDLLVSERSNSRGSIYSNSSSSDHDVANAQHPDHSKMLNCPPPLPPPSQQQQQHPNPDYASQNNPSAANCLDKEEAKMGVGHDHSIPGD